MVTVKDTKNALSLSTAKGRTGEDRSAAFPAQTSCQELEEAKTQKNDASLSARRHDPCPYSPSSARKEEKIIQRERVTQRKKEKDFGMRRRGVSTRIERKVVVCRKEEADRYTVEEFPHRKSIRLSLRSKELDWIRISVKRVWRGSEQQPIVKLFCDYKDSIIIIQVRKNTFGPFLQISKFVRGAIQGRIVVPRGENGDGWCRLEETLRRSTLREDDTDRKKGNEKETFCFSTETKRQNMSYRDALLRGVKRHAIGVEERRFRTREARMTDLDVAYRGEDSRSDSASTMKSKKQMRKSGTPAERRRVFERGQSTQAASRISSTASGDKDQHTGRVDADKEDDRGRGRQCTCQRSPRKSFQLPNQCQRRVFRNGGCDWEERS